MHYAPHILIYGIALLSGGGNAAKTVVSPEVLTTFAKNVASVLSPALVGDLYFASTNRSAVNSDTIKSIHVALSPDIVKPRSQKVLGKPRVKRETKDRNANEDKAEFQDARVTRPHSENSLHRYSELVKLYPSNHAASLPRDVADTAIGSNAPSDDVAKDSGSAAVHHLGRFQFPAFYRPQLIGGYGAVGYNHYHPQNHYYPYHGNRHPHGYPRDHPQSAEQPAEAEGTENTESNPTEKLRSSARVAYRPFDLDYNYPLFNPPFYRPNLNERLRTGSGASARQEDQSGENPGSQDPVPPFRRGDYGPYRPYPDFIYGHPGYYPPGFYPPGYYPPHNSSAPEPAGNSTEPGGQPGFRGYGFNPYYPYPGFQPHPPPKDQENSTDPGEHGHHGYHFKPFHGGFYPPGYPVFNPLPYGHFNYGFNYNFPGFKGIAYPGFYPHFSYGYPYPGFAGFYPKYPVHPNPAADDPAKPAADDPGKPAAGDGQNAEAASEEPVNPDAELIPDGEPEAIRTSGSNRFEKFSHP